MAIAVCVVYSPVACEVDERPLSLQAGSTVRDALRLSGILQAHAGLDSDDTVVGVWGRRVPLDQLLLDHDRVEIYRPLQVDPKVARRERFQKQGARSTGLFARKRDGAKAGY